MLRMRSHSSSSISASGAGLFSTPALLKAMSSSAERLDSARDRRLHLLGHRDVAGDYQHLPTRILDRICVCRSASSVRSMMATRALGRERDGGGAPDDAGSSGNEGDLAGKRLEQDMALPQWDCG